MALNFTKTQWEIIDSGYEDVAWLPEMFATHVHYNPGMPDPELVDSFVGEVLSLIDDGYVVLCRENWSTAPRDRKLQPADPDEIAAALTDPLAREWDDSREAYYCLVATKPKGEEAFFELIGRPSYRPSTLNC